MIETKYRAQRYNLTDQDSSGWPVTKWRSNTPNELSCNLPDELGFERSRSTFDLEDSLHRLDVLINDVEPPLPIERLEAAAF